MLKTSVVISLLIAGLNGCDHTRSDMQTYSVVVDKITKGGLSEQYDIHRQYIGKPCKDKEWHASAYLCTRPMTNDTVLVISPCKGKKFEENTRAVLFVDGSFKLGDTLTIYIPKEYERFLHLDRSLAFGLLDIPID